MTLGYNEMDIRLGNARETKFRPGLWMVEFARCCECSAASVHR